MFGKPDQIPDIATSSVNRLASQVCRNRLFRKKLRQKNLLHMHMLSTEVSSLVTQNRATL
jgi:hypothetical protein